MKNLAVAVIFSGLFLVAGVAFGAETEQTAGKARCLCSSQIEKGERSGSTFKPLFPEYEVDTRIEG